MKLFNLKTLPSLLVSFALVTVVGCGGTDSGQENVQNTPPQADDDQGLVYNGPVAATDDVTQFKINIWDNLAIEERCGGCHNEIEGQDPQFLRRDDINLAYELALPLVDKQAPVLSRLVERAAEGHGAWDPSAADTIENLISRWATATGATANEVILLPVPEESRITAGATLQFSADSTFFETIIYDPILNNPETGNCSSCHSPSSAQRQAPFFASGVVEDAYIEARKLIDLANPANSRLVERMREGHNVWAPDPNGPDAALSSSVYSAREMQRAIEAFVASEGVPEPVPLPDTLKDSFAARFVEPYAQVASSGGRIETDVIALYQFREGSGSVARDSSGVTPQLDLNLSPSVEWLSSWGIRIEDNGKAQGSTTASKKLHDLIKLTGEYSVEAWLIPGNVTQEESRIITYSGGTDTRNFSLNQTLYDYQFLTRSENSDENGMPLLNTPSMDEVLQATLQHVVATYDPIDGRRIYVNGELIIEDDTVGSINDWDETFVLAVGNEVDNAQWWEGIIRFLAIHNRVLDPEQVVANFDSGVGQKYFMLFDISEYVDWSAPYVVFTVELFDEYSYLFSDPFFINLDEEEGGAGADFTIEGMRIGVNGEEFDRSQAFANINVPISSTGYTPRATIPLSTNPSGTLIAQKDGQFDDVFFLTFDVIGTETSTRADEEIPDPAPDVLAEFQEDIGIRMFDEIFQNMSAISTVPSERVYDFYTSEVRRSLPSATLAKGFLASQQAAVTQLALAYCTELVNDATLRNSYFGDYGSLSTQAEKDALIDPLLDKMLITDGGELETHPAADEVRLRLDNDPAGAPADPDNIQPEEITGLLQRMESNTANTKAIAVCTSVLSSAAMLMQ